MKYDLFNVASNAAENLGVFYYLWGNINGIAQKFDQYDQEKLSLTLSFKTDSKIRLQTHEISGSIFYGVGLPKDRLRVADIKLIYKMESFFRIK